MSLSKRSFFWLICCLILTSALTACLSNGYRAASPQSNNGLTESLFETWIPQLLNQTSEGTETEAPINIEEQSERILQIEEIIIALLFIATVVGIATHRLRVPYTVGLVLIGVALALIPQLEVHIPSALILGLLVPPLIFEAAFHLDVNDLRNNLVPITVLAVPGVVLTMLLVGGVIAWGAKIPLIIALVFGAVVAATDPIAVIALFKAVGVPKRLQALLEGESLFNDGTAIVIFGLVLAVAMGGEFNLVNSVLDFIVIAGGGLLVGVVLGTLISHIITRIDDYLIETALTSILAFGSYLVAEAVGVSGVLAVVAAGLVNGNIGPQGMSPTTRIVVFNFWEYAGFLANSFAFLLLGLQIELAALLVAWQPIMTAILAVLIARAVIIYGLSWVSRDIPFKWKHVLVWGGLRGAISLALVLSLPESLGPAREQLQIMVFGVVLFTLVVQGFSMGPLVRRMGLTERSQLQIEYERRHARAVAMQAAYDHLGNMKRNGLLSDHTWQILSPILTRHNQALVQAVKEIIALDPTVEAEEMDTARRESLRAQRSTLHDLFNDGVISDETYSQLVSEVDAALTQELYGWPEVIQTQSVRRTPIDRLVTAVIQEQDFENAASALSKMGLSVTCLPTTGGFLRRRNLTLLIGISKGQEEITVRALSKSCKRRVEYLATPLEGTSMPLPTPMAVTVGGATIFSFEVERYEEF